VLELEISLVFLFSYYVATTEKVVKIWTSV